MEEPIKRRASELEVMVCEYLNQLRIEDSINMFGAVPYIATMFEIDRPQAKMMLEIWMNNFNEKGDYQWIR